MQKQPLFIMLLCFITGIITKEQFQLSENAVFIVLLFSLFLLFLFLIKKFWTQKIKHFVLGFFFFAIGIFAHFFYNSHSKHPEIKGKQKVIFEVNKKLNSNEKNRKYEVSVIQIQNFEGKIRLPLKVVFSVPKENKLLDFKNFYQTDIYLNKLVSPKNDFQFDYAKYLARKNIFYQTYVSGEILILPKNKLSISQKIKQKRADVLQNIDRSTLEPKTKEFLKGIILADRTEMDQQTISDFSKSGLVHLLAISGSHMVIIFWLISLVLNFLFPVKFRKFTILFSLVFLWAFAIFIDYGSSVIRSCIMISAYYFFVLLQRKPDLLHAMALAGFVILISDTNQLFDVGFQLSFLAVLGIFWLNQPILKYLPKPKNKFQNLLVNIPSISISAQLATLPLVIYYFHQYSLVSIVANLIILPFSEIIIIFSLFMAVVLAFKIDFDVINSLYSAFVNALLQLIHWFAEQNFLFIKNIPMTIIEVAILLVAVCFLRNILVKKETKSVLRFSYIMMMFIAVRLSLNDVGLRKNEILLIENFNKKTLIIKQGNKAIFYVSEEIEIDKLQKNTIDPYLSSRRIKEFEMRIVDYKTKTIRVNGKEYSL